MTTARLKIIPDDVRERLIKREASNRYRMTAKNKAIIKNNLRVKEAQQIPLLPIEKVDIIKVGHDQEWICGCHRLLQWDGCFHSLDLHAKKGSPDAIVIGHIIAGGRGGGHIYDNIALMRHECNQAISNKIEKTDIAKTNSLRKKHMGVDLKGRPYKPKKKKKIKTRPGGMQSRSQWPKGRKIKVRGLEGVKIPPVNLTEEEAHVLWYGDSTSGFPGLHSRVESKKDD